MGRLPTEEADTPESKIVYDSVKYKEISSFN